jgi:hypothetical protein
VDTVAGTLAVLDVLEHGIRRVKSFLDRHAGRFFRAESAHTVLAPEVADAVLRTVEEAWRTVEAVRRTWE